MHGRKGRAFLTEHYSLWLAFLTRVHYEPQQNQTLNAQAHPIPA